MSGVLMAAQQALLCALPPPACTVIFAVLILIVLLLALAIYKMKWPKTSVFLVACLWLTICLLMFIGTGGGGHLRGG